MTKTKRLPRKVPVLTAEQQRFLTGITQSGQFTLEKAAQMYAGVEALQRKLPAPKKAHLFTAEAARRAFQHVQVSPKKRR